MKRSVLLAACRWLRQKLDSVERFANGWNSPERETQVSNHLAACYGGSLENQMNAGFQSHVADAAQQAPARNELEKHYRGAPAFQQGQIPVQPLLGRQGISSHIDLQYRNQPVSVPALSQGSKPCPTKRRRQG